MPLSSAAACSLLQAASCKEYCATTGDPFTLGITAGGACEARLVILVLAFIPGLLAALLVWRKLDVLPLGDAVARTLGRNAVTCRIWLLLLAFLIWQRCENIASGFPMTRNQEALMAAWLKAARQTLDVLQTLLQLQSGVKMEIIPGLLPFRQQPELAFRYARVRNLFSSCKELSHRISWKDF